MEILQEIWKQNLRPRAVVGYGVKIFLPSPPNYVTRSRGYTLRDTLECPWRINDGTRRHLTPSLFSLERRMRFLLLGRSVELKKKITSSLGRGDLIPQYHFYGARKQQVVNQNQNGGNVG